MPPLPDGHTIFVLATTALALFLFTRDRLPLEASSLAILVILILSFQFFPYESHGEAIGTEHFLLGFGHEALITICALMIMGKGLEVTGALQPVATFLAKAWMAWPRLASLVTLVASGVLSAFLNNTPIVVMLLPMLVGVAVRNKFAPSAILMPMGLATLVGGMATTIGTSTNLLVVAIAQDQGLERFSMFEFAIPAIIVGSFGMVFLWLVAPRLLPERKPPMSDTAPRVFNAVLHIHANSAACGLAFAECLALTDNEMRVERIERGEDLSVTKLPSVKIREGDRLVVRDTPEKLKLFEAQLRATLHQGAAAPEVGEELQHLAQLVVTRDSKLYRASLLGIQFAQRTGLLPLALHRARDPELEELISDIGAVSLRSGDVLLVQGTAGQLAQLKRSGTALVLDGTTDLPRTHRAPRAMLIMALVILAAATGVLPIEAAAVAGVGFMLASRCLRWGDAAGALSPTVIMIIVASLALGVAMIETDGALYLAQVLVQLVEGLPTPLILSCLMLVMAILTNIISNNATGVIGAPVAIQIANELGASPEPFVLAVIFGANMSYVTPYGYKTNILLMSAGGYKATDFVRAGLPLMFLMWAGYSIVLPLLYDL
ncbi:MAG: SLC13 family permease [Rhodospirillaceae bacterium]|nr:SLC13 family permease [Rhodospirillaceae bacterium]